MTEMEHHGSQEARSRLREAVFGVQDGLISTMGALTGIAAGTGNGQAVLVAGFVIIVVESLSMAAGSYLSSKSHKEYLQRILKEEEEEIEREPEKEREELWQMYRKRGYTDPEIEVIAKRLMGDKKLLLEDMAHKELGIFPDALEEPASNALVMGVSYSIGGLIPVLPYLAFPFATAMRVSIAATFIALFLFGGIKGRVVKQGWWRSGLEMLLVAGLASGAGFLIGRVVGVAVH